MVPPRHEAKVTTLGNVDAWPPPAPTSGGPAIVRCGAGAQTPQSPPAQAFNDLVATVHQLQADLAALRTQVDEMQEELRRATEWVLPDNEKA